MHFEFLRKCLDDCNSSHPKCRRQERGRLPTRLIHVGSKGSPKVSLYITQHAHKVEYIALSHPWGKQTVPVAYLSPDQVWLIRWRAHLQISPLFSSSRIYSYSYPASCNWYLLGLLHFLLSMQWSFLYYLQWTTKFIHSSCPRGETWSRKLKLWGPRSVRADFRGYCRPEKKIELELSCTSLAANPLLTDAWPHSPTYRREQGSPRPGVDFRGMIPFVHLVLYA